MFLCYFFGLCVHALFISLSFCYQYQCNWLPGKFRFRNDLLCVQWDVKPCSTQLISTQRTADSLSRLKFHPSIVISSVGGRRKSAILVSDGRFSTVPCNFWKNKSRQNRLSTFWPIATATRQLSKRVTLARVASRWYNTMIVQKSRLLGRKFYYSVDANSY